eukprot:s856_g13.t4
MRCKHQAGVQCTLCPSSLRFTLGAHVSDEPLTVAPWHHRLLLTSSVRTKPAELPPLQTVQVQKVSRLAEVQFPPRVSGDVFHGQDVKLHPHKGSLGEEGRLACASQPRAAGVWRGTLEGATPSAAAAKVLPLLPGSVALDACGTLADTAITCSCLHFLPSAMLEDDVRRRRSVAAQELGTASGDDAACGRDVKVFVLAGQPGQVLSHHAELFLLARGEGRFETLLRLVALAHAPTSRAGAALRFPVTRESPLGALQEVWKEVAMVELPRLFQLSVRNGGAGLALPGKEKFLVEESCPELGIGAMMPNLSSRRLVAPS